MAYQRIFDHDHAGAVSETTKTFIDELRTIGEHHKLPFVTNINDQLMVDQALRNELYDPITNKKKDSIPAIQLNNLKRPSDKSEQKGYHAIMCGLVSAVRHPPAHAPLDNA